MITQLRKIKQQMLDVHEQLDERCHIRSEYIWANGDCLRNTGSVNLNKNKKMKRDALINPAHSVAFTLNVL